jgi:hypothetical protein
MKPTNDPVLPERFVYAAQNAQDGLINVNDLSLLTGIEPARLNGYAKKGFLTHYGEYHGKRLFNFSEIVAWVFLPGQPDEVRTILRTTMEGVMKLPHCPFDVNLASADTPAKVVWRQGASPLPASAPAAA